MAEDTPPGQAIGEEFGNFASFALVSGMVSAIFVAAFLTAFPGRIGRYFGGIAIAVLLITFVVGLTLDLLGFFGNESSLTRETESTPFEETDRYQRVRSQSNEPLPRQINFNEEVTALKEYFDGDVPRAAQSFFIEYEKLRSSSSRRKTQASSVRSALNPVLALVDDEELEASLEQMGEDLFAYIKSNPAENIIVTEVALTHDGTEQSVMETQGQTAHLTAALHNEGEAVEAELSIRFTDPTGAKIMETTLPTGRLSTEERIELNTDLLVPAAATDIQFSILNARQVETGT
ncbi:hypothetical protein DM867_06495 [Halosegnis rubeus]|jgi:hypothetical protein|uniref:Uncharacterized protein n=1 Tax=Halosegnis rubeus TaxID=2212850 RepID=A0A5N5ULF3_9EURY|nr:hypothetical protein [Halosegnis rubeus]KAB7514759.1 hypothetical protein DM867_06495 [Halosegnis rubeus]KAB7518069.1 hypothetical protein DMP03_01505 [Halosegnis rubeus]KAB7519355.1 hypothetical protein DP108_04420 [Halosegnis rubeus]